VAGVKPGPAALVSQRIGPSRVVLMIAAGDLVRYDAGFPAEIDRFSSLRFDPLRRQWRLVLDA
jgi:hypothetical protein